MYENYHGVKISNEMIKLIVNLTERYVSIGKFPDKAIDVLDEACCKTSIIDSNVEKKSKHLLMEINDVKTNKNGSVSIDDGQLTIEKGTKGYYDEKTDNFYIIGTLTNNSSDDYDYVTINYHVSDKDGNILGNATDSIDNLEKGKSWKFKVVYENVDAKEVKNFKINNVSTY